MSNHGLRHGYATALHQTRLATWRCVIAWRVMCVGLCVGFAHERAPHTLQSPTHIAWRLMVAWRVMQSYTCGKETDICEKRRKDVKREVVVASSV